MFQFMIDCSPLTFLIIGNLCSKRNKIALVTLKIKIHFTFHDFLKQFYSSKNFFINVCLYYVSMFLVSYVFNYIKIQF